MTFADGDTLITPPAAYFSPRVFSDADGDIRL